MKNNKITQLAGHDISWFVRANSVTELDEYTTEHIERCIADGITQGEICMTYGKNHDKETTGWWSIVNWKSIAMDLYLSISNKSKEKKARKAFDDVWDLM